MIRFLVVFVLLGISPLALNTTQALPAIVTSVITSTTTSFNSTQYNSTKSILPIFQNPLKNNFGNDLGTIESQFNPNGTFTMLNIYHQNLTIGKIQLSGVKQNSTHVFYNSTTEIFNFGTVQEYFDHLSTGFNISIVGNFVGQISLPIPNAILSCPAVTQVTCNIAKVGYELFAWDNSFSPSWNNQTDTINWQVSGAFNIDPLALDGNANCAVVFTALTCGVSLTTSSSPDVLYCTIGIIDEGTSTPPSVSTITDNKGNTWHNRIVNGYTSTNGFFPNNGQDEEGWYTTWSSSGAISITITVTGTAAANIIIEGVCVGVSGANTGSPFDSNAAIPAKSHSATTTTTLASPSISTNNANDFLITGIWDPDTDQSHITKPSGWTFLAVTMGSQGSYYNITSTTDSSVTYTWTSNIATTFALVLDAIQQAANSVTIHVQTTTNNNSPFATITLSGCVSTTYTADGTLHTITGATASATCTETVPADTSTTRYRFPNGTLAASTWQFTSCAISPCGNWINTVTWQLKINMQAFGITPTITYELLSVDWNIFYDKNLNISTSFLYVGNTNTSCLIKVTKDDAFDTCSGGSPWADANTTASFTANPTNGGITQTQWMCQFSCSYVLSNSSVLTQNANYYNPPILAASSNGNYGYTAAAIVVLFGLALAILVAGIRMKKRK